MVKGRLRTLNRSKIFGMHICPPIARGCGADNTLAYDSGPLATRKGAFKPPFKPILNQNYFTNFKVLRFNSTFTFLPNTNVYPCTLVLPI